MTRHYTNVENTKLGQFLHIEMWTKTWSKTNSSGEFVNQNTPTGKTKFNKMLQARIQHSGLLKYFQHSRTPMEKMKIWKSGNIFFGKNWKYFCDIFAV